LPVVATDVGGVSEQIIDGVNGRLLAPRDVRAFAQAMIELAKAPKLREAMGAAAREHVRRHFSLERMTAEYLKVLGVSVK
jgi:glycosyltransferase involved in cell wall biosynthesis